MWELIYGGAYFYKVIKNELVELVFLTNTLKVLYGHCFLKNVCLRSYLHIKIKDKQVQFTNMCF